LTLIEVSRKAISRSDTTYISGCLFRVIGYALTRCMDPPGQWLVNEKGAVTSAGRLSIAPTGFADRAQQLMAHLGATPSELTAALDAASELLQATSTACRFSSLSAT
jgi:hypothetical protein